jgi:hypothetical protein
MRASALSRIGVLGDELWIGALDDMSIDRVLGAC